MSADPHKLATNPPQSEATKGVIYGLAAYLWWGFCPIYFKAVAHVPAAEVLAHRILWSVILLGILLRMYGRWDAVFNVLRDRRTMLTLVCSTILIAINWFTFIWAVANDRLMEASLGYFINPLVNVLLGFVFLRERLRTWQWISVVVAAVGVCYRTISLGELPVVSMILATSFGLYGLLRKTVRADSMVGLMVETSILFPIALAFVVYHGVMHTGAFGAGSISTSLLLILGGVVTAVPLIWFTNAARRLRYATIGFMQYIAPSMQFILAVVVYHEPFTRTHLISFGFIWLALIIYSVDTVREMRRG